MLHVPGAAAQSTSPFGVCRMRRTANGALKAPDPSALANPVWFVSQSPASPELLFLHWAKPTGTFGVNPLPEMVTLCRWTRSVDGVTVSDGSTQRDGCVGNGRGRVRRGRVGRGGLGRGGVGVAASHGTGDVDGVVLDGVVVDGSVVDGGVSSANAGTVTPMTSATTAVAKPTRSPRRRIVSSVPVAPGTPRTDTVRAKRHVCNLRRR